MNQRKAVVMSFGEPIVALKILHLKGRLGLLSVLLRLQTRCFLRPDEQIPRPAIEGFAELAQRLKRNLRHDISIKACGC